jgi:hypothetical protein
VLVGIAEDELARLQRRARPRRGLFTRALDHRLRQPVPEPPSARLRTGGPELTRWPASAPLFVGANGHRITRGMLRAAALLERTAAWGSNVPRLAATSARPAYRTGDHHAAGRDGEKPADPGLRRSNRGREQHRQCAGARLQRIAAWAGLWPASDPRAAS